MSTQAKIAERERSHSGFVPKRTQGYEFKGKRAQLFKEAMSQYPSARRDDLMLMRKHLDPRLGEHILGFGEGSGFFCRAIAEAVGRRGRYVITEPSPELFNNIPQDVLGLPQIATEICAVEDLDFPPDTFDKAWACGAFHHSSDQTSAISAIYKSLKPGGRMVIFDVFAGTPLAKHFDSHVARYCETGHEVKFMSEEFARTLCFLAGFADEKVKIVEIPHRFWFASLWDMGNFIWKMHALTRMPGDEEQRIADTVNSLREHLLIEEHSGQVVLHFDQRAIIATK